jgi:hypothetical protein
MKLPEIVVGAALGLTILGVGISIVGFTHATKYENIIREINTKKLPEPVLDSLRNDYKEFESIIQSLDYD